MHEKCGQWISAKIKVWHPWQLKKNQNPASSKMAPRILIFFLIAIGADYSYEVKCSEIWVPTFFMHNKFIYSYRETKMNRTSKKKELEINQI